MIALGELALATIGVSAIIKNEVPKMGIERQREAVAIQKKIPRLAGEVVDGGMKRAPTPRPHSYPALLKRFSKELQPQEIQALVDKFPHDASEMSGAFLLAAQAALEHLRALFPMSVYSTFAGPRNLVPDDVSVWKFFSQLEVLNDPLCVFPLMGVGAILKSQTEAMRAIYPSLSEEIDSSLYEAIAKKVAASSKWQLPPRAEQGVSVWLGRRIVAYRPPPPPGAPPPGPAASPPAGAKRLDQGLATRTQRAIEGT